MTDNNANWKKARIKDVSTPYTGNSIKDEHKDLYIDNINAIPYISTKDINDKFQTIDFDNGLFIKNSDKSFRRAPKNSTLLCIEGGNAGKKIAFNDRTVCFVNKLCCFHSKTENNKFLYYFLMSPSFTEEFKSRITGLIGGVSVSALRNIHIRLPAPDEQEKIANFLDEKCTEIDKLSEDIQKQIDILNDYKKSVITRAVTKGLNPNVKKKDSGQLHIGDIPEEWEIVRVKDVFKMQSGFTPDSKRTDYYDDVNGFNWVTIADINKKSDLPETTKSKISKKYIEAFHPRMAKAGSLLYSFKLSIGQVAFVKKDTYTNEAIISFSCKDTRNLRFLKYSSSLIEYNANTNIYGSKILNQQLIGNAHITLPPIDEQDHIADYLDDFTAKMSDIIDEKNNQLEKIDLYKKSIIYEYVTGKKRVKGAL